MHFLPNQRSGATSFCKSGNREKYVKIHALQIRGSNLAAGFIECIEEEDEMVDPIKLQTVGK